MGNGGTVIEGYDWDYLYAEMYKDVIREPRDGSVSEAIKVHAQACGFVAYAFDVHPDRVAQAVSLQWPVLK
jgi:hypothetical protein